MAWNRNDRIKQLVETSYANQSDEELLYLQHTKVSHSDEHIAATIILKNRAAKIAADKEAREVARHMEMGQWIASLKILHWTSWVMFAVGIASMLIALFAWRSPIAVNANKSPDGAESQQARVLPLSPGAGK